MFKTYKNVGVVGGEMSIDNFMNTNKKKKESSSSE